MKNIDGPVSGKEDPAKVEFAVISSNALHDIAKSSFPERAEEPPGSRNHVQFISVVIIMLISVVSCCNSRKADCGNGPRVPDQ